MVWVGIRVQRPYKDQTISQTKNKRNRNIDTSPQLLEVLRKQYLEEKKNQFSRQKKGSASPKILFGVWAKLLEKAKYDYRKFHTTRHTFASLLISANKPLVAVKEQMGHHSIQITVDVYGHFIPSGEGITDILDGSETAPISTHEKRKALKP